MYVHTHLHTAIYIVAAAMNTVKSHPKNNGEVTPRPPQKNCMGDL